MHILMRINYTLPSEHLCSLEAWAGRLKGPHVQKQRLWQAASVAWAALPRATYIAGTPGALGGDSNMATGGESEHQFRLPVTLTDWPAQEESPGRLIELSLEESGGLEFSRNMGEDGAETMFHHSSLRLQFHSYIAWWGRRPATGFAPAVLNLVEGRK